MPIPFAFKRLLRAIWQDIRLQRGRYVWMLFVAFTALLCCELLPQQLMPWHRWLYVISTLALLICTTDLNMLLWRVYQNRDDLRPVRGAILLISLFLTLLTVGRVLGFASAFVSVLNEVASVFNLLSTLVAVGLVLLARSVEEYAVGLPSLSDLSAAHSELREAQVQLSIRETNAHEGMTIMADDVILEANAAAYRLFGYDQAKQELIGMRAPQLLHEDDTLRASSHTETSVVRVLTKTGAIKTVDVIGTPMERRGTLIRVCNFKDITFEREYLTLLGNELTNATDPTLASMKVLAEMQAWFSTQGSENPYAVSPPTEL